MNTSKKNDFVNKFHQKIQADAESIIALYVGLLGHSGAMFIKDLADKYDPEEE